MRTSVIATCVLIASLEFLSLPAIGTTHADTGLDPAMANAPATIMPVAALIPDIIVLSDRSTQQIVSSCVEPSPCQTHADCDFPFGFCLPNLNNPPYPPKSCVCL